jgi:hypothetical protein
MARSTEPSSSHHSSHAPFGTARAAESVDAAELRVGLRHHRRQFRIAGVNRDGQLVGPVFGGNIESLIGNVAFNPNANRAVAVYSAGMIEALRKIYDAGALVDELLGVSRAAAPPGTAR